MRRLLLLFVFLIGGSFFLPQSAQAAACSISTDTVVNQAYVTDNACTSINIEGNVSTTWIGTVDLGGGTVTVKTGYTMTMGTNSEMVLGAADDFTIEANATTTHTAADANGLKITARNVTIVGALDVDAKGCQMGAGYSNGFGPNLTTGVCTISTSGFGRPNRGGAAHAGYGGSAGFESNRQSTTYGSQEEPTFLGSSGANFGSDGSGHGGGRIRLIATGSLSLNGSVSALGATGRLLGGYHGGGGAGGSVWVTAASVAGTGAVRASGGAAEDIAGAGGGGRVALYYGGGSIASLTLAASGGVAAGGGGAESGGDGTVYTLQTNQAPNVPASLGQSSLVDGSTTGTTNPIFTFTLSDDDVADTLQYRIQIDDSSDFSSPVVDYTSALAAQGAATFQVGQAAGSGAYAVGSVSQMLTDGSYYWRVKTIDASAAESSYTTANSGSVAFIVDSATRTVSFAYSTMSSLESVTATSVRVVLDTTHFENVTVNYSVTGGTATGSGTDYTLSSGTATITAGETSTTIAIVVVNDEIDEPDEAFVITLADPAYATLGATDELTYTITDNDTAGITSSESAFSLSEGGASDTFTLVLTSKPTSTVTVTFTTSTAGITLVPDALAFTTDNWATPQTVTISATDDSRYESSHTTSVVMTVSGGVYGYPLITPPTITATITDNETSDITLSASTLAVTEGSFGTLTFVLASQPTSTVTLVFATPSESALSASSLTFTADNWSTSQMLTVNILNNRDYVGTRTATLTTTVTSDTTFSQVAVPTVTITINEDDAPPGGGAVTAGPGAFYVPFPLDYVPPVTTVPTLPPQTGGDASSPAPVTDAPTVPSAPASNQARTQVSSDATSFRVTLAPQDQERLASFIDTGTTPATQALGSGERRALVRDALDTMGRAPTQTDLERLAQGQIPQTRNLAREREQLPRARSTFRTIYGRDPNFQNPEENLAWNTLMYRIRFTRDLAEERQGIATFRQTFRRAPSDPFQWAVVRVLGYVR